MNALVPRSSNSSAAVPRQPLDERRSQQLGEDARRFRPLEGDHRRLRLAVLHRHPHPALDEAGDMIAVGLRVGGVVDDKEPCFRQPVDEDVVDDAAVLPAEQRVVRLPVFAAGGRCR